MSLTFAEENGYLLPFDGTQALASSNPWEQAQEWCREIISNDRQCVVVGLGAGFHIVELLKQKKFDKIYVIDDRPALVNIFRKQFPEYESQVDITIVDSAKNIFHQDIMNEVSEKYLSTFAFFPCWPKKEDQFRALHRHLTGRSPEALQFFLKKHGQPREIQVIDEGGKKYLSVKDLEVLIQEEVPHFLRLNCFRIMKELIH